MPPRLRVLYEDNHLLIVNKPAGMPTMGVSEDQNSIWRIAKQYLKEKYNKPGNVYLGVVSRLDAPVSGVLLFARTSKAAARLNQQFLNRDVQKDYLAIAEGQMEATEGEWTDWIVKDERAKRMRSVNGPRPHAKQAVLEYRLIKSIDVGNLIGIRLKSGRKHQIRVQLSVRGHPILGDQRVRVDEIVRGRNRAARPTIEVRPPGWRCRN